MDTGKKPQSHDKKVGQGSVGVNKTGRVDTGGRTVGSGGRPAGAGKSQAFGGRTPETGSSRPFGGTPQRNSGHAPQYSGGRAPQRGVMSGGFLLVLLVVIVIAFFLLRGGSPGIGSSGAGTGGSAFPGSVSPSSGGSAEPQFTVSENARPKRYVPLGGGQDTVTVMIYMCGTDLESNYGMATSDLKEMLAADIAGSVNVIVETGGCRMWKNNLVSASTNQIYKVESGSLKLLRDNIGSKAMVEPATLVEFIGYCQEEYPADRNILILWDHGGGSISGYGYDELYKNAGSMDLAELSAALREADCVFDWIGFDACLMATLETALVCGDYADYLIASEETEPGTGWYYTGWLTALSKNTSVDTVTLSKRLIDDYVSASTKASASAQVTLSLVDLAELQGTVPAAFNGFATSTAELIAGDGYAAISNARAGTRQFARSSRINQIDLADFADRVGTSEAAALSRTLRGSIKYNRTTIPNAYGLSIYFPYETTSSVKPAISTYQQVGMDEAYTKCISSFASLSGSGQLVASAGSYGSGGGTADLSSLLGALLGGSSGGAYGGSSGSYGGMSPLGSLLGAYTGSGGSASAGFPIDAGSVMSLLSAFSAGGRSLPDELDWMDTGLVADRAAYIASNYLDPGDITVTVRPDGKRVLSLTGEQWALIQSVELNVFVDDGEGFIDLGLDNVFDFDGNDLLLDFDGTWLTVNDHVAAFYMDYAGDGGTIGHIPAMLTQAADGGTATQLVYLEVVFDDANPYGTVVGARPMYDGGETGTVAKGGIAIGPGDVIYFLCDYYTYDNQFDSAYKLGEPLTVGSGGLEIVYHDLGDANYSVTYRLTDIYSNHYWTPAV